MKSQIGLLTLFIFFAGCDKPQSSADNTNNQDTTDTNQASLNLEDTKILGQSVDDYYIKACASCHGNYGDVEAFKKSKVIKDMSVDELVVSLKGYRDGTYGGDLKNVMVPYVKSLNDDDIKALSNYISNL